MPFANIVLRWKSLFWRPNGEIDDDTKAWSQSVILALVGLNAYTNNEFGVRNGLPDIFSGLVFYHHDEGVEYWDDVPFTIDKELNRPEPSCDCKVISSWLIAQCRIAGIRSATPYIKWTRRRRPDGRISWMYHVLVFIDAADMLALAQSGIVPYQNTPSGPTIYKRKNKPGWLFDGSRPLGMNYEAIYARSNRKPRSPEFRAWFEKTFGRPMQPAFVIDESNPDPAKQVMILSSEPFLRAPALPAGTNQDEEMEDVAAGAEALMSGNETGFDFSFLDPTNKKGMTRGLIQTLVPGGGLITALADKAAPAIHDATKQLTAKPHAAPGDDGGDTTDDEAAGAATGDQRAWWSFISRETARPLVQQAISLAPQDTKARPGFQAVLQLVAAGKFLRAYGKLTIVAPDSLVAAYGALGQDQNAIESAAYAAQAAWQQSASAGAIGDEMDPDTNPALQQRVGQATLEQLIGRIRIKPIVDAEGVENGMRACLPLVFGIDDKPIAYEVCKTFSFSEAQKAVDELIKLGTIPAGSKASIEDCKDCGSKVIAKFFATWLSKVKDAGVVTNVAPEGSVAAGFSALFLIADPELIADAMTVVKQARAGDTGAIDKVKKLATAAQEGNTKALHAVQVIKAVDQGHIDEPAPEAELETAEGESLGWWDRIS